MRCATKLPICLANLCAGQRIQPIRKNCKMTILLMYFSQMKVNSFIHFSYLYYKLPRVFVNIKKSHRILVHVLSFTAQCSILQLYWNLGMVLKLGINSSSLYYYMLICPTKSEKKRFKCLRTIRPVLCL